MLQEILIAKEASYSEVGQRLHGLKPVNFIFGTNGSGKTTISRVVANAATYPACNLVWANGRAMESLVYNSDFTSKNFASQMPGIFTLGEETTDAMAKIEVAKDKIRQLYEDIEGREATLGLADDSSGKRRDLRVLRNKFEEKTWAVKATHDAYFQDAFTGYRNSKVAFCDKILEEFSKNAAKVATLEDLKNRALTVFEKGLERQPTIATVSGDDLIALEQSVVLAKKVVGKEDVDVATLIRRLGNSDWVREGLAYINDKGSQCPFCQQDINDDLSRKLNDYFDEAYTNDIAAIDRVKDAYEAYSDELLQKLEAIYSAECRYIDSELFRAHIDRLAARIELNKRQISRKRSEPSAPVTLEALEELVTAITTAIEAANTSILGHNAMVDNISNEKTTLVSEVWKYLLEENKLSLTDYIAKKLALDKAVEGLTAGIIAKRKELAAIQAELSELERSITSVQPTVTEINSILSSFGFTSFKLATAGDMGSLYEIVRGDGTNAATTLSEGEKSFITFLYFYHLLKGSTSQSGMNAERVIVFDDPVSSLDSDVLFIVSALIKRVLEEVLRGDGLIKQVFILTHNIYFHKEVSFDPKRTKECRSHETFWIVRKVEDQSVVSGHDHNPIKTSYELLWTEVRNPQRSNLTIQNTLRRILENYFKILGNLDKDEIVAMFDGQDQQICGSLFSWVNDGSHSALDDLYISADGEVVARYLDVFRRIFEKTQHKAHYDMMMGPELADVSAGTA